MRSMVVSLAVKLEEQRNMNEKENNQYRVTMKETRLDSCPSHCEERLRKICYARLFNGLDDL